MEKDPNDGQEQFHQSLFRELGKIQAGIEGVHRRQDVTNGKVLRAEEAINALQKIDINFLDRLSNLEKDGDKKNRSSEKWKDFLYEKGISLLIFLAGLVLIATGIIDFDIKSPKEVEIVDPIEKEQFRNEDPNDQEPEA
jgi:hypothetical protein